MNQNSAKEESAMIDDNQPKSKLQSVIERHNLDPSTEEKLARIIDLTIEARNEGLNQEDADELEELTNWFYYEIC
ncbi:MAG: hypothetical protein RIC03_12450 [Cyclobacteriaceae bacterium]